MWPDRFFDLLEEGHRWAGIRGAFKPAYDQLDHHHAAAQRSIRQAPQIRTTHSARRASAPPANALAELANALASQRHSLTVRQDRRPRWPDAAGKSSRVARGVRTKIGSGALSVVTVGAMSVEEDAVAEQGEAGSAVHLAHDVFGFGVDAFGSAVVVGHGHGGVDGVVVEFEAAGEGVQVWQVGCSRGGDPRVESCAVVVVGS
jgi:hypothetical protein